MAVAPTQDLKAYKNYIGGEWVEASGGETFEVENPSSGEVFATVPKGGREDAHAAIAAARQSLDSGVWADMDPDERVRIMRSVVDEFTQHEDELAELESLQSGMTMRSTATVVIGYCIEHWDYFARQAGRSRQEALPPVSFPTHSYNFVLREPIGVCAGIVPLELPVHDGHLEGRDGGAGDGQQRHPQACERHTAFGPRAGEDRRWTMRPSEGRHQHHQRPRRTVERTWHAPEGRQDRVHRLDRSRPRDHADGLEDDQKVHAGAGRQVREHRPRRCRSRSAVDGAILASFLHSGQVCESGTRLLLPDSIYDKFMKQLLARIESDPRRLTSSTPKTKLGPLVKKQLRASRST